MPAGWSDADGRAEAMTGAPSTFRRFGPRPGLRVLLAGLLWVGTVAHGAQAVGGVRVLDEPWENGLRLLIRNDNLAAVTLTVHVFGENATPERAMPMVVSCRGQGVFPLVRLRADPAAAEYSYRVRYDWQFGEAGVTNDASVIYELPYPSGRRFPVDQGFRGSFTHQGNNEYAVDFGMPVGSPVLAARAGVVEVVVDRFDQGGEDPGLRDRVNFILVRHADGTYGEYVHLRSRGARVRPGQKVGIRQLLGYSGNTGYSQGPHLHFAVFRTLDGTRRETFPMRFRAREGEAVEPVEGARYTAP